MDKESKEDLLYEIAEDFLEPVEEDVSSYENILSGEKSVKFITPEEEEEERKRKIENRIELAREFIRAAPEIKEIFQYAVEFKRLDNEAQTIKKELDIEIIKLQNYREALKLKSDRLEQLINNHKEQVEKVMKIVEYLPAETEEQFERKLQLIDRCNSLLSRISDLVMKFITL